MANWRDYTPLDPDTPYQTYSAEREDGTLMEVTEYRDLFTREILHEIYVESPDGETEYLMGDLEDTTVQACIERAEDVTLPDEDTGM